MTQLYNYGTIDTQARDKQSKINRGWEIMTNTQKAAIAIESAAEMVAAKLIESGMSQEECEEYCKNNSEKIWEWAINLMIKSDAMALVEKYS